MIRIEKLQTFLKNNDNIKPPTYVDVFHSNPNTYFNWYYKNFYRNFLPLLPNDIKVGEMYGIEGKPIQLLLSEEPDDTIYEIDCLSLSELPQRYLTALLKNHRILISELMEWNTFNKFYTSGGETGQYISTLLRKDFEIRELIEHDCGPMFALFTHDVVSMQYPDGVKFNYTPKKLALVPARKPRANRIRFLAELQHVELLNDCDWSLTYVEDANKFRFKNVKDGDGDFYKSPNVNAKKWKFLGTSEEPKIKNFYEAQKQNLPKSFDMPNNFFSDTSLVAYDWFGNYKFKVALETIESNSSKWGSNEINSTRHFITEKTFKGFMLGLPTMVFGPSGIEQSIKRYGFEFYDKFNYDHLDRQDRIAEMVSCLQQEHDVAELKEIAKNNFEKMWDKNYLVNLFVSRFK